MNRRPILLAGLALLLSLALGALPVRAAERPVLLAITVGDFSWQEGHALRAPGQLSGRAGTLKLKGGAPTVGKKWDQLRIGLPKLPNGKKPYLVLQQAEVTAVEAEDEDNAEVSFVFQDITWTYEINGATHYDRATGDE